jgi:hypothetical protein
MGIMAAPPEKCLAWSGLLAFSRYGSILWESVLMEQVVRGQIPVQNGHAGADIKGCEKRTGPC